MTVRLILASALAALDGGATEHELEGATLHEALQALSDSRPALSHLLWKPGGVFNPALAVFLNDRMVALETGLDAPLSAGDEITVISALEGG